MEKFRKRDQVQEIKKNIDQFIGKTKANYRYSSYDYCYNHFYTFYKNDNLNDLTSEKNLEKSCLQIGFYLASWGMMRGSSFLLERSSHHYAKLIRVFANMDKEMWEIDVNNYNDNNIDKIIKCKESIICALGSKNSKTWDNKVSKIMLGVFGNIPAYDRYFKRFLKGKEYCQTFNVRSLKQIKEFYDDNKVEIDKVDIKTRDFLTLKETNVCYTKAKLIDMYGFIVGRNDENKNKKKKL